MPDSLKKSGNDSDHYVLRPTWDDTWITMAVTIARRSLCSRDAVGAVIVDIRNRPIAMGYNGPPAKFNHELKWCSSWCQRGSIPQIYQQTGEIPKDPAYNDCPSLHAEQNALITADKANFTGGTIYVSSHLCGVCAKLIANSGLKRVVVFDDGAHKSYREYDKWYIFLKKLNICVDIIEEQHLIPRG